MTRTYWTAGSDELYDSMENLTNQELCDKAALKLNSNIRIAQEAHKRALESNDVDAVIAADNYLAASYQAHAAALALCKFDQVITPRFGK